MRRKRLTWGEKFYWFKLALGLFITMSGLAMLVYGGFTAATEEQAVRAIVQWGTISGIGMLIAVAGTIWGCLG